MIILENENNLINKLLKEAQLYMDIAQEKMRMRKRRLQFGLTDDRIRQFDTFEADDSFFGDVCLEDVDLGRMMVLLDCKYVVCLRCVENWFAVHKTCPTCRHQFA